MTDKDQIDFQQRVKTYQDIVKQYETLDKEIDALIMRNGGASKNMSDEDREKYLEMVRRRSDLHNEVRIMESELFDDENK